MYPADEDKTEDNMERTEAHDFYLLKAKRKLSLKSGFYSNVLTTKETASYLCLDTFWMHDDFIGYISPSFTGLSIKLDYTGVSLITEQADAEKLVRICEGWIMVIQEMAETVLISAWDTEFQRQDLLSWMEQLKSMAEQMRTHEDYVILYFGI